MFTANAKSVFGRIEVAALLGHASADTAKLHYAQRRLGSGVTGVRPIENDVAAVAKRNPEIAPKPLPPLPTPAAMDYAPEAPASDEADRTGSAVRPGK